MNHNTTRARLVLVALATLAALMPVSLPLSTQSVVAGAECTTCCPQAGSKCVVCAFKCVIVDNSYDSGGTAPCENQT